MNRIVTLVAPRGAVDFFLKLIFFLMLIGGVNYVRDVVEHGPNNDSFFNNVIEAMYVALPFCVFALALVRHMKTLQDKLVQMATTDLLTNLPNRRAFLSALEKHLPRPGGVLMMIDVDHFKRVNDTFGHAVGDSCLQLIAEHLAGHVGEGDIVARLGGEEFGLLLVGASSLKADRVGAKIADGVDLIVPKTPSGSHKVTLSIGAVVTGACTDTTDLLRRADLALYQAKHQGRARLILADDCQEAPIDAPPLAVAG